MKKKFLPPLEVNNSLEKLPFMTWGFIWRLWTNSPPPPFSPTGRQEGQVTNAQMSRGSQGQRPGGGILSKSKRNVYYHWKWTSPLKNCTLWLEASSEQVSEDSEPIVDPFVPPPPNTHTHNRETTEEVTNVQMPSSSQGRPPGRPLR